MSARKCGTCGAAGHNSRTCRAGSRNSYEDETSRSLDYTCVLDNDGAWHLTQEQAEPPPIHRGGAWTSCVRYVEFRRGYDKRRPTCAECVQHATRYEESRP
jgi:hypothetical protein